ncbi:hypothetical protein IIY66_02995 [Candidatus Saccharibacteria bacterium]|nr:hypothetical protein [Candidatus Saccharibacteria bacterium]
MNDGEEETVVPNTSADGAADKKSNTTKKSPATGDSSQGDAGGVTVMYVLPIALIIGTTMLYIRRKNKSHRKFE